MEACGVTQLFDLSQTIAAAVFDGCTYPWEALPKIHDFVLQLGNGLPETRYEKRGDDIWIAKSAVVAPTAYLHGPVIIGENAEVRHCAFIRGNAIVGEGAVVGNSTELKNVILFNGVQVPHYNYVGDSILGYQAHMGAGSITSNVKGDKSLVTVKLPNEFAFVEKRAALDTGLKKFGAILGDHVEVGCNSVLNPGCVVGRNSQIYPLSMVRGFIPQEHIYKCNTEITMKYGKNL